MIEKLIRCVKCNAVTTDPESGQKSSFLAGIEWSPDDRIRQNRFFHSHKEHKKEELRVIPESHVSVQQTPGGLGTSYFKTTNGSRKFLIRRTKVDFDDPARYELLSGRMRVRNQSLSIQEEDLRRQISAETADSPLRPATIDKFIEVFREGVNTIPPQKAVEALDIVEGEEPLVAYGTLKKAAWEKILTKCRPDVNDDEIAWIRRFISENGEPDNVLALRIQRKISFRAAGADSRKEKAVGVKNAEAGL
jgi:hypothetical protein